MIIYDEAYDEQIRALMKSVLAAIEYDIMKIVDIDFEYQTLYEAFILNTLPAAPEKFTMENLNEVLAYLSEANNAVVIDRDDETPFSRVNKQYSSEIYVPFYSCSTEIAGFIYYAKESPSRSSITTNLDYLNLLKKLIFSVENKHYTVNNIRKMFDTIMLIAEMTNAKYPQVIGSLYTVFNWAKRIAEAMHVSAEDIQKLQLAVIMHDFGKVYINDSIVNKSGRLTEAEYEIMKTRVAYSYDLACKIGKIYTIEDVPNIILNCQERVDGKGYPSGKTGDQIPLLSKIIYMAKALTAMLSNTPYRKAMPIDAIIDELRRNAGSQFDAEITKIAIHILINKKNNMSGLFDGIGNYVILSMVFCDNETMNIWGSIRKYQDVFEFIPSEALPVSKFNQLTSIHFYVSIDDQIMKFKPEVKHTFSDKLVLSKLISLNEEKTFSINWVIDGLFVTAQKNQYPINIITVGGDFLDFYTFADCISEPLKNGITVMDVSDDGLLSMPGIIVFQQNMFDKVYFRFEYRDLPEIVRKKLFSAIFRKQLEIKRYNVMNH